MAAYVIFTLESVSDREALAAYRNASRPSLGQYGGRFVAGPNVIETLEGDVLDSAVIVEFDDVAAAHAWYYSPEYQSHVGVRHGATTGKAVIIQGRA